MKDQQKEECKNQQPKKVSCSTCIQSRIQYLDSKGLPYKINNDLIELDLQYFEKNQLTNFFNINKECNECRKR
jgi:hypothetical protein